MEDFVFCHPQQLTVSQPLTNLIKEWMNKCNIIFNQRYLENKGFEKTEVDPKC